jgi:hypothetical protein
MSNLPLPGTFNAAANVKAGYGPDKIDLKPSNCGMFPLE